MEGKLASDSDLEPVSTLSVSTLIPGNQLCVILCVHSCACLCVGNEHRRNMDFYDPLEIQQNKAFSAEQLYILSELTLHMHALTVYIVE